VNFVYRLHGEEHAELCRKSQDMARQSYPDATFTVYCDKDYGFENQVVVDGYHDKPFMLMTMMCQAHYLMSQPKDNEVVVFLDSDAFVLKKLPDLGEFDVCVTWRDNMGDLSMLMPYNYGVVFARRTVNAAVAWTWMCQRITQMKPEYQKWYADQVAIRELVGGINYTNTIEVRDHGYFDVRVAHLPCQQFNWSPDKPEDPGDRYIVHFKGARKDMADYYYRSAA